VFNVARDSLTDFPKVTPNDLRHTAASLAVSAGGNVLALARMLGHEDPSRTLRTYGDLFDSDLMPWLKFWTSTGRRCCNRQLPTATMKLTKKNLPGTAAAIGIACSLSLLPGSLSRGGGIRTHGLFVPNEARYQAAPHPD
jgi:hypothetical protein